MLHDFRSPVVKTDDDRFAVSLGGEFGAELGDQLFAKFDVVVDLAIEHERVALGRLGRTPAQRLVRVTDVNDRQAIETEDEVVGSLRAYLVRAAVVHAFHCRQHRIVVCRGLAAVAQ